MFPHIASSTPAKWLPGPYEGVELMPLRKDPDTGGVTVLRKFSAGTTVPAHIHPEADESVYILEGQWNEDGVVYGPGTYFHVPKGQPHGPHVAVTEVVSLTLFSGPLTVKPV